MPCFPPDPYLQISTTLAALSCSQNLPSLTTPDPHCARALALAFCSLDHDHCLVLLPQLQNRWLFDLKIAPPMLPAICYFSHPPIPPYVQPPSLLLPLQLFQQPLWLRRGPRTVSCLFAYQLMSSKGHAPSLSQWRRHTHV